MFKNWGMHFAPDGPGNSGAAGSVQPFGETGDVAILAEGEDEATPEKDDTESEDSGDNPPDENDETPDDEAEDDAEGKEKDDKEKDDSEEEEEDESVARSKPALKTITAKYPNIFKEFPALKDAYFRADAYAEVFPSVEDARDAAEKADILDTFEEALVKRGSAVELLNSIKESDPRALGKFVDNLLPELYKFDSNLFLRATEPVTRQLLWSASQHGKKSGDKNLVASAQHISNYLFGDAEVIAPKTAGRKEEDPERIELERDKANFEATKRNEFLGELNSRAGKQLVKIISDGLDPKSVLSDFMKTTITEKVMDEIGARLEKDTHHMARMRTLHSRAAKAGFPKAMTDQITATYLSAAKLLIPVVRNEIKAKALGRSPNGNGNKSGNRQIPVSGGNRSGSSNLTKNLSPKQVDWAKTSDLDFLNDKVTLKGSKH